MRSALAPLMPSNVMSLKWRRCGLFARGSRRSTLSASREFEPSGTEMVTRAAPLKKAGETTSSKSLLTRRRLARSFRSCTCDRCSASGWRMDVGKVLGTMSLSYLANQAPNRLWNADEAGGSWSAHRENVDDIGDDIRFGDDVGGQFGAFLLPSSRKHDARGRALMSDVFSKSDVFGKAVVAAVAGRCLSVRANGPRACRLPRGGWIKLNETCCRCPFDKAPYPQSPWRDGISN